jgi:hypothetical protein
VELRRPPQREAQQVLRGPRDHLHQYGDAHRGRVPRVAHLPGEDGHVVRAQALEGLVDGALVLREGPRLLPADVEDVARDEQPRAAAHLEPEVHGRAEHVAPEVAARAAREPPPEALAE